MSSESSAPTSRWRLLTSAETPETAEAAARSLIAALLVGRDVPVAVAPWFRGGFQVEFVLTHEAEAEEWVERALDRACLSWTRTDAGDPGELELWSHELNVPRAEALEVRLKR